MLSQLQGASQFCKLCNVAHWVCFPLHFGESSMSSRSVKRWAGLYIKETLKIAIMRNLVLATVFTLLYKEASFVLHVQDSWTIFGLSFKSFVKCPLKLCFTIEKTGAAFNTIILKISEVFTNSMHHTFQSQNLESHFSGCKDNRMLWFSKNKKTQNQKYQSCWACR